MTVEELNALKNSKQSNVNKLIEEHAKLLVEALNDEVGINNIGYNCFNGFITKDEILNDIKSEIEEYYKYNKLDNLDIEQYLLCLQIDTVNIEIKTIFYNVWWYSRTINENLKIINEDIDSADCGKFTEFSITFDDNFDISIIQSNTEYNKKLIKYLQDNKLLKYAKPYIYHDYICIDEDYNLSEVSEILNALKHERDKYLKDKEIENNEKFQEIYKEITNFFEKSLDIISEYLKTSIENNSELDDNYSIILGWFLQDTSISLYINNQKVSTKELKYDLYHKYHSIYDRVNDSIKNILIDVLEKAGYTKIKVKDSTIELSI